MKKKHRYVGTQPFKNPNRELFFGRDEDINGLSKLVAKEKLVVLVGRSGVGKTSLLNAGVIPKLIEQHKYALLNIHLEEQAISPLVLLVQHLENFTNDKTFLTKKFNIASELPKDHAAKLWYYTKIIQILHKDYQDKAVTLVFDHFEELFIRYPNDIDTFSQLLATMLNYEAPKSISNLLSQKVNSDPNYFSDDELKQLLEPLNLKIVLSVRNDYMGELNRLKKFLPEVFNYTYELLPLNGPQALEAIEKPAQIEGDYFSPSFKYSKKALERILKGLLDSENNGIEAFQLQLIGEFAEETIKSKQKANPKITEFEFTDKDLGRLDTIWENHYKKIIDSLPLGKSRQNLFKDPLKPKDPIIVIRKTLITRRKVKEFIENVLIVGGKRVPVDKGTIVSKYEIPENILGSLADNLLIEPFLNTVGTPSYQLRHDTLIGPILKSAEKRRKKELKWLLLVAGSFFILFILALFGPYPPEPPQPPDGGPSLLDLKFVISPCSPDNKFPVEIIANYADKNGTKCEECKIEIIKIIGLDSIIIKPQPNNYYELSKGVYSISATDSVGGITKDDFIIPHCESTSLSADYLPLKAPDSLITADPFSINPVIVPITPILSNLDTIVKIPQIKNGPLTIPTVVTYDTWVVRLRALKEKVPEPCEKSKVRSWHFNEDEAHLIAIRKDTADDPTQDEVLLLLLIAGKVIPFKSYIPHLEGDCMLGRQKRYDLRVSLQRSNLYKDSLSLVSKRFKNPAGDAVVSMQENVHNDPYDMFVAKIREAKPKTDEIYYTFLDEEYLDDHARFDIKIVFDDSKTEYLYLPFEM